jgi:hypothetical protein
MGPTAITSFDPVRLGRSECDAWVGYYRRDWMLVLRSVLGMVRSGFGLSLPVSVRGAWYVLRANQAWAPYPVNDPGTAVTFMERFYALVARAHDLPLDARRAALLEVDWWREHRLVQRGGDVAAAPPSPRDHEALVASLARLYAYVYGLPDESVRPAARLRAEAMQLSDAWVSRGCRPDDPELRRQRRLLVASYTTLRQAVEPVGR